MIKLTQTEEEAMKAVWSAGEGSIKTFMQFLNAEIPYTTLASTIKKLEQKGYVTGQSYTSIVIYKPAISEEAYKQKFMNGFVKEYFSNSYKEMVNFFIQKKKLSPKELKEIIDLIEKEK